MRPRPVAALVVLAAAVLTFGAAGPSAGADGTKLNDPAAVAGIGLCDQSGHQLTSGNLTDEPFAWRSISTGAAPAGYERGKATLFAFQPRPQVPPENWSGRQLTGSSTFPDAAHPLVQATPADRPLLDFVQVAPPEVDGLVQLRIIFTAIDSPSRNREYPAAFVRVSGSTWRLVDPPAQVDCAHAAAGVSSEAVELPPAAVNTPQPFNPAGLPVPPTTAAGQPSATSSAPGASAASGPGDQVPGSSTTLAPGAAPSAAGPTGSRTDASRSAGGGVSAGRVGVVVGGAIASLLLVAAMARWRLRRS